MGSLSIGTYIGSLRWVAECFITVLACLLCAFLLVSLVSLILVRIDTVMVPIMLFDTDTYLGTYI